MGISYLIDTHILLWWLFDDPKLNPECREIIRNPTTYDAAFRTGLIQIIPTIHE